jgi:hypothetical protein
MQQEGILYDVDDNMKTGADDGEDCFSMSNRRMDVLSQVLDHQTSLYHGDQLQPD